MPAKDFADVTTGQNISVQNISTARVISKLASSYQGQEAVKSKTYIHDNFFSN